MTKDLFIGIMTGNSMDAIDVVLTDFSDEEIRDVCTLSHPFAAEDKKNVNHLRQKVAEERLSAAELCCSNEFLSVHRRYLESVAAAVAEMCRKNGIDKKSVRAIGFHGKTLDHNPPSRAAKTGTKPFTIQMGSAQMLADLTGIPVVNDFRSDLIFAGFEGAPLAAPHNARIARMEGDGCYYNGGNTSNLTWVYQGAALISWDAGPFNEYPDNFVLNYKNETVDWNAHYGSKGNLMPELLQELFNLGRTYYEMLPPKSGDPAYYHAADLFSAIEKKYGNPAQNEQLFYDVIHTLEYFSGYLAAYAVTQTPEDVKKTPRFILFGGGWKNPVAMEAFKEILTGHGFILPEHRQCFHQMCRQWPNRVEILYSKYGTYMEARLFADLARCHLAGETWNLPELKGQKCVLGCLRTPFSAPVDDYLSRAARGWQEDLSR